MASNRNFVHFFRNIGKKQRLSLRDQHNDSELWYMHISPLKLIGGVVALLFVLFIVLLTTVAYTPVLNLIPGYDGNMERERMIQNIMRIDSIEQRLNEIQIYASDVSLIMDGKTPFIRNVSQQGDTLKVSKPETVFPNAADSALRRQMEGDGIYSLGQTQPRRQSGVESGLRTPVSGVVAERFNPKEGDYGVGVATASSQQVVAVKEGTVTISSWSPGEGHLIQIQHTDNLISIYRHFSQSSTTTGTRVKGGEVIGYTGEGISGEEGKGLFEFELWHNGSPIDPENYIVF